MNFHSTHTGSTSISTLPDNRIAPDAGQLASYLASYQKREKREIGTRVEKQAYEELQTILKREKKTFQDWLNEQITQHIKTHGAGNPVYKLTNWTQNPEFLAIPAFMSNYDTLQSWFRFQAKNKNWDDLQKIKHKLDEWNGLMRRYYGL